jgi:large subunit ribosomal protein L23
VRKVNILNTKSKPKRIGRYTGRRPGYKKAVVSLEEGHNIEVFDQV